MCHDHLPPGIEVQVHEAILALVSCKGLEGRHLQTIRYCIAVCPSGFYRAYINYFDALEVSHARLPGAADRHSPSARRIRVS